MQKTTYLIGDKTLRVEIEDHPGEHVYNITVFEEAATEDIELLTLKQARVVRRGQHIEVLEADQSIRGTSFMPRGAEGEVNLEGNRYLVKDADLIRDEGDEEEGSGPDVTAPMPGRIVQVLVAQGDPVEKGASLMIVESMKMETTVLAGVAGTVKEIPVAAGDNVDPGDLLVKIEPTT